MKRVLFDVSEGLTRVALIEDGKLVELYYETEREESLIGNIYAGRVENVIPNLQACFVEIGAEKKGYLYYGHARAVSDQGKNKGKPKVGDTVIVQVEKDATGTKGAVLSEVLSYPGKFLVLLADEKGEIGVSRKITGDGERERIRLVLRELLPEGYGVVVRTNGVGRSAAEFEKEMKLLLEKAEKIKQQSAYTKAPALFMKQGMPVEKAVRDFYSGDVDEFVINQEAVFDQLSQRGDFGGDGQPRLVFHEDKLPIFESYFVESQGRKALEQKVWLKSGGFLVIEETEACVVIDVNSGKMAGKGDLERMILKTNLEAADEAAKQLRLRNLSGIIIVDFIDMSTLEDRNVVTKALKEAVSADRIKTVVVGMTELGLMQITRKKTRPSLQKQMTTKCRACEGSGRLPSIDWTVTQMRREIEGILANTIYDKIKVQADGRLLSFFGGKEEDYLHELHRKFDGQVICEAKTGMTFSSYIIKKEKNRKN